jgi:hypothetical protein
VYTSKSSAEIEAHVDLVHSVQVPELKAHLERLGLDQSGLKADLSKRLKEAEGFAAGVKEGAAASALEPADRTAQKVWITYIHTYNIHVYMHACMHACIHIDRNMWHDCCCSCVLSDCCCSCVLNDVFSTEMWLLIVTVCSRDQEKR